MRKKERTTIYINTTLLNRLKKQCIDNDIKGGVSELLSNLAVNYLESKGDFDIRSELENEEIYI